MSLSRRLLLRSAYAAAVSYSAFPLMTQAMRIQEMNRLPLVRDPNGIIDLPEGFSYSVVSQTGGAMSDGFFRPGRPDGMACLPILMTQINAF